MLTGRERFQADRNRSWAARRDVLPSSRPAEVEVEGAPAEVAGSPPATAAPADLQVNRLEVIRPEVHRPDARPVPARSDQLDIWPLVLPGEVPVAAPRAAVLPTQSSRSNPPRLSRGGRRGSPPEPSPDRSNPIDDLVPRQARRPSGVDLATSADELFPPSTRRPPADLLGRRPAGTSTGMLPKIFAPGHGLDESALPVLVGEPVPDRLPRPGPAPRRLPDVRLPDPPLPDPRLPVRPRPPVSLGDAVLDLDAPGFWTHGPQHQSDRRPDGGVADLSLLLQASGEPAPAAAPAPRSGSGRVAHSRREVGGDRHRGTGRGWALPTFTAAVGLVAGILYASGGDQAAGLTAAPAPVATVTRPAVTVTVTSAAPIRYANCAAVRRAGVAPLRLGEPGYRKRLDPDGDGVAC